MVIGNMAFLINWLADTDKLQYVTTYMSYMHWKVLILSKTYLAGRTIQQKLYNLYHADLKLDH